MTSANLTRDETAARSAAITLETVEIDLDLRGAPDLTSANFTTTATLVFGATTDATWVDFLGAAVDEVTVNGAPRDVVWDGARVQLEGLEAHNTVTIRARGRYSTSGEGLHRFRDPVDDQVYLYTQHEPADARRVYPCFEQPDMKARWSFTVSAPATWQILSNGAEIAREVAGGAARVSFAETLPLSSYITAVAAGPYHRVDGEWTDGERRIPLGVLCRQSLVPYLDADEILEVTQRGLSFFQEAFAYPYPWGKYDQLFVPEYNLGAMENPGLVTFTDQYIFRGASTAAQHEGRANTILHEMAHMWFGDLVTMRWWDDLWLKESFADYMGAHVAVAAGGFPDAWVTFASRRKAWAYAQDQLPTTHPIVADIPDLEAAKLNFDGITYAKGASVLKQLVAFVGEDAFFRGAQRYFAEHAFGNTTLGDLLTALEAASGRDLRAWSAAWLETSGISRMAVLRGDDGALTLVQDPPRPQHLTVGLFRREGEALVPSVFVGADTDADALPLGDQVGDEIALIVPNVDDSAYAKVRLDERSTDAVMQGLGTIEDALTRAVIWGSLWDATRDGELPAARYLETVTSNAPAETNSALLADALAHADFAIGRYVSGASRDVLADAWVQTCWNALWAAEAGSDAQLAWARALGGAAERSDMRARDIAAILTGTMAGPTGLPLDDDLRWSWLTALSATAHASVADADAQLAADPSAQGRLSHRTVLAARPDAKIRGDAWHEAWTNDALTNDELSALIDGVRAGESRPFLAELDADYFARIRPLWTQRSMEITKRLVIGLFPASESLTDVDAWLAANKDAPGALCRLILEQRDNLARALRVRAAQPH